MKLKYINISLIKNDNSYIFSKIRKNVSLKTIV